MQESNAEWTDEQIYQAALEEWLGVLARLWTAFGKALEPDRLVLYRQELGILPLGLLEKAISRVIREHVYNSVPTVADVWGAMRKELHNPHDIERAIQEWEEARWQSAIYRFDVASSVAVETESVG